MGALADPNRRWIVLGVGLVAMVAGCAAQYGLPFLIPALQADGFSLEQAGFIVTAPVVGVLVALIAWGAAADRFGERVILAVGLGAASAALGLAAGLQPGALGLWVLLVAAGAASASIHAASGRLILGWFPAELRGRAMGVRQTGQPIGVAIAAVTLPFLAQGGGIGLAFAALAAGCVVAAVLVAVLIRDPARPPRRSGARAGEPYRDAFLWRVHAASGLLIVPQWAVATFAFEYLVAVRHWSLAAAGALLAVSQVGAATGRVVAGFWSDRVGSRLGPMRLVAAAIAIAMATLAASTLAGSEAAVAAVFVAGVLVVSPNGLAFTAVAERAGSAWAGRALGIQNTVQNGVAVVSGPALAGTIAAAGADASAYGWTFAAVVVAPVIAAALIPVHSERRGRAETARTA